MTPLDEAFAIMSADDDDEAARLGFYARLAAAELFLLLEGPAEGDRIEPQLVTHDGATFALVFDLEERLTQFTGAPAPLVAMSGRVLAGMLYGQDIGLALNPEVAPSSYLLPAEAVDWLAETLAHEAETAEARIRRVTPPNVPDSVLATLDRRIATFSGRATRAYLVGAEYSDDTSGLLLAIVGAEPAAQGALAQAVSEVVAFAAMPLRLDAAFFEATDMALVPMSEVGLRFDVPMPASAPPRAAPGSDPAKPPILR